MPASKEINARRLGLFAAGVLIVAFARSTPLLFALGAACCLIGECWRLWGCGHLEKNQEITNTGPYAHVQNPLYLGTVLILIGLTVAGGNWPATLLGALFFFGYYFPYKVRTESDRLRRRFGDRYDDYFTRVPKLVPALRPYPGRGDKRFSWARVVRNSEIGTALAMLAGLALVGRELVLGTPGLALAPDWAARLALFPDSLIYLPNLRAALGW